MGELDLVHPLTFTLIFICPVHSLYHLAKQK